MTVIDKNDRPSAYCEKTFDDIISRGVYSIKTSGKESGQRLSEHKVSVRLAQIHVDNS